MTVFDGIRFNGKHSYRDYGMFSGLPTPSFDPPTAKTRFVDIPGADGLLDQTEAAGGVVRYNNRTLSFVFVALVTADERDALRDELTNELHGRNVTVIADSDPDWYYEGRAAVTFDELSRFKMKVNVTVDAQPYKLAHEMTEIPIGAESFDQVDIFVGQGVETQVAFSAIYDVGNVSRMSKLILRWDTSCPKVGPISVNVTDGTDTYVANADYSDFAVEIPISTLNTAGVDTTNITKVLLSGIRYVKLYKQSSAGALLTVVNDRMPVCPYWENPNEDSVEVFVNGKTFTIGTGETLNPDIVLDPGENEVAFTSDSVPEEPLVIRFRKGRL